MPCHTRCGLEPDRWAAKAAERVTNLDSVNVLLSTEHFTRETVWRGRMYTSNRFLRTRRGMSGLSTQSAAPVAYLKLVTHRAE